MEQQARLVECVSAPVGDDISWTKNCVAVKLDDIARMAPERFRRACIEMCRHGGRLAALTFLPAAHDLLAIIADDATGRIGLFRA